MIAIRTVDPLNLYASYYGSDGNGRVDSIWTVFSADSGFGGSGGGVTTPKRPGQGNARNDTADVVYRYTRLGVVDSLLMPRIAEWG